MLETPSQRQLRSARRSPPNPDGSWEYPCLIDGGQHTGSDDGNGIEGSLCGEVKLQLCRERLWVAIIDDVEIGKEAENTLVLFGMDLLGSDFLGVVDDGYRSVQLRHFELAAGQDQVLAGSDGDCRGSPIVESFGADADGIGSCGEVLEFKVSAVVGHDFTGLRQSGAFQDDGGTGDAAVVYVGYCAVMCPVLGLVSGVLASSADNGAARTNAAKISSKTLGVLTTKLH